MVCLAAGGRGGRAGGVRPLAGRPVGAGGLRRGGGGDAAHQPGAPRRPLRTPGRARGLWAGRADAGCQRLGHALHRHARGRHLPAGALRPLDHRAVDAAQRAGFGHRPAPVCARRRAVGHGPAGHSLGRRLGGGRHRRDALQRHAGHAYGQPAALRPVGVRAVDRGGGGAGHRRPGRAGMVAPPHPLAGHRARHRLRLHPGAGHGRHALHGDAGVAVHRSVRCGFSALVQPPVRAGRGRGRRGDSGFCVEHAGDCVLPGRGAASGRARGAAERHPEPPARGHRARARGQRLRAAAGVAVAGRADRPVARKLPARRVVAAGPGASGRSCRRRARHPRAAPGLLPDRAAGACAPRHPGLAPRARARRRARLPAGSERARRAHSRAGLVPDRRHRRARGARERAGAAAGHRPGRRTCGAHARWRVPRSQCQAGRPAGLCARGAGGASPPRCLDRRGPGRRHGRLLAGAAPGPGPAG